MEKNEAFERLGLIAARSRFNVPSSRLGTEGTLNFEPGTLNELSALLQGKADHLRRIPRTHGVKLVLIQSERFHVTAHEAHRFHRIWEKRFAGVARQCEMLRADFTDRVVHDLWVDAEQR